MRTKILLLTVTSFLFASNVSQAQVTGSGTLNKIAKWTVTGSALGDSQISDNGTNVGIGNTSPGAKLSFIDLPNSSSADGITWYSPAPTTYGIFRTAGTWSSPNYQQLQLNWITGIILNPGASYGKSYVDIQGGGLRVSSGNVGIGTTTPLAKLHLNNGSVLFNGTTGATPTSGAGTRMMWIPSLSGFRAGLVTGNAWDVIGTSSVAFGEDTQAPGWASSAFGSNTIASGSFSTAFGRSTTASGLSSVSAGNSTIVSGNSASAFGYNLVAQSYSSFVIGSWNLNPGTYSTTSSVATDPVFVIGNGTSPSTRANAITVLKNGNMLINKTTQLNSLYKLDIAGTMRVNEIVVNLTGADFVFNSNYKLLPLKELELFIKENSHLPEIASAEEMETGDGVKIGEMQTKLLQKIEELTLYLIELNKTVDNLTLENKVLKTKFDIK